MVLKLWKAGFSLDDGELRNYNDPGNANFLEAIRRGWDDSLDWSCDLTGPPCA